MPRYTVIVPVVAVLLAVAAASGEVPAAPAVIDIVQEPSDPVAELRQRIESRETRLAWDSAHGYLPATLEALGIPASSQSLVFSRTSLQTDRIAPWAPRALYFNDDVYVAWVLESPLLEIASVDPHGDIRFYTISQAEREQPVVSPKTTTCLLCHESRSVTGGRPGLIMLSVLVDRLGYPVGNIHEGSTTDRTPYAERWGGWYVTGTHGDMAHAGNVRADVLSHEVADGNAFASEYEYGGTNVTELGEHFFTDPYLTPHSDIVALMVLTHQVNVHNLMGLVRAETEAALELEGYQLRSGTVPPDGLGGHLPSTVARIEGPLDRLFRAMLFVDELPLPDPVAGTSEFAAEFSATGPADPSGASLRELDLGTRLFRHRLSFLVHSDAFRALPELPKSLLAERLVAVLEGEEPSHLTTEERTSIRAILQETEPDLLALGRR